MKKTKKLYLIAMLAALIMVFHTSCGTGYNYSSASVLTYHLILDEPYTEYHYLFVKPADFEAQLKYISESGAETVFASELTSGKFSRSSVKPVCITFDDGYEDNYTNAFPLLKKYNIKATIFVVPKTIGTERHLTDAQLYEMSSSGLVSIQSHGLTHSSLVGLSREKLEYELSESKELIESITCMPVTALCYPYGAYDDSVKAAAARYYTAAFTTEPPSDESGYKLDVFAFPRSYVVRDMDIDDFKRILGNK
ncbi:MAG: polysaccharide deacetylase family protein [Oscillospiraceae bacterium]|nr:polysaccharide deacetylase family protein [Oscillospiraceae bacterium]